jgi:hypothetical protein
MLVQEQGAPDLRIPLSSIFRLEQSAGRRSRGGVGALAGLGIGATVGYLVSACDPSDDPDCFDDVELVVSPALGAIGALIGWAIGRSIHTERWVEVSVGGTSATATRGPRLDLAFSVPRR